MIIQKSALHSPVVSATLGTETSYVLDMFLKPAARTGVICCFSRSVLCFQGSAGFPGQCFGAPSRLEQRYNGLGEYEPRRPACSRIREIEEQHLVSSSANSKDRSLSPQAEVLV